MRRSSVLSQNPRCLHVMFHNGMKLTMGRLSDLLDRVAIPGHSNRLLHRELQDSDVWRSTRAEKSRV